MTTFLYIVAGIFALFSFGIWFSFLQSRHLGLLLASIAYGGAAFLAFYLVAWWPLLVGFILAWLLRFVGTDPGHRA